MKKHILILFVFISFMGCNSSDPEDQKPANDYSNTTWEAPDEIAQLLFGGNNVQRYEFTSASDVQHTKLRNGTVRSNDVGTYTFSGTTVTVNIDGKTFTLERSGSLLVSTLRLSTGGFVTYQKK